LDVQRIPIRYGQRFIDSQLDMCVRALDRLRDRALAVAMQTHVAEVRARAMALNLGLDGLRHGNDYIVVAAPRGEARAGAARHD
ncbi:MAG: class I SAM-dependent methyltransferase, partial [Pseudomonadota bacterium]|nr:class I SAM-dependent methyltransferase [Pseudomonadota bacterium]